MASEIVDGEYFIINKYSLNCAAIIKPERGAPVIGTTDGVHDTDRYLFWKVRRHKNKRYSITNVGTRLMAWSDLQGDAATAQVVQGEARHMGWLFTASLVPNIYSISCSERRHFWGQEAVSEGSEVVLLGNSDNKRTKWEFVATLWTDIVHGLMTQVHTVHGCALGLLGVAVISTFFVKAATSASRSEIVRLARNMVNELTLKDAKFGSQASGVIENIYSSIDDEKHDEILRLPVLYGSLTSEGTRLEQALETSVSRIASSLLQGCRFSDADTDFTAIQENLGPATTLNRLFGPEHSEILARAKNKSMSIIEDYIRCILHGYAEWLINMSLIIKAGIYGWPDPPYRLPSTLELPIQVPPAELCAIVESYIKDGETPEFIDLLATVVSEIMSCAGIVFKGQNERSWTFLVSKIFPGDIVRDSLMLADELVPWVRRHPSRPIDGGQYIIENSYYDAVVSMSAKGDVEVAATTSRKPDNADTSILWNFKRRVNNQFIIQNVASQRCIASPGDYSESGLLWNVLGTRAGERKGTDLLTIISTTSYATWGATEPTPSAASMFTFGGSIIDVKVSNGWIFVPVGRAENCLVNVANHGEIPQGRNSQTVAADSSLEGGVQVPRSVADRIEATFPPMPVRAVSEGSSLL